MRIERYIALWVGLVLAGGPSPLPAGVREGGPAECGRLLAAFRKDVVLSPKVEGMRIEYCPDETCEVFVAPKTAAGVCDFAYLYLFHVSGFIYLEETRKLPQVSAGAKEILERHRKGLKAAGEQEAVKSVLEKLAQSFSISLAFVRYDEGQRTEEPVLLKDELARWRKVAAQGQ